MIAVVSGRAGVAVLVKGEQLFSLHFDEPEQLIARRPEEYGYLIGEGTDLEFLEEVELGAVRQRLEHAVQREEALEIALLLLDGELPDALRTQAAADLQACLAPPGVLDSLEAVLYAAPLPTTADLPGALRCSQNQPHAVLPFLERLQTRQPTIRRVRQAWEAVPESLFGGAEDRRDALTLSLRAGLFRDLADTYAGDGFPGTVLPQALNQHPQLTRFRRALDQWSQGLRVLNAGSSELQPSLPTAKDGTQPNDGGKLLDLSHGECGRSDGELMKDNTDSKQDFTRGVSNGGSPTAGITHRLFDFAARITVATAPGRRGAGGLTELEYLTLAILGERGTILMGEIHRLLGVLPARMSRIIRALQQREPPLITCRRDPCDAQRMCDVSITQQGQKAMTDYRESQALRMADLLRDLSDEDREDLQVSLERVASVLVVKQRD